MCFPSDFSGSPKDWLSSLENALRHASESLTSKDSIKTQQNAIRQIKHAVGSRTLVGALDKILSQIEKMQFESSLDTLNQMEKLLKHAKNLSKIISREEGSKYLDKRWFKDYGEKKLQIKKAKVSEKLKSLSEKLTTMIQVITPIAEQRGLQQRVSYIDGLKNSPYVIARRTMETLLPKAVHQRALKQIKATYKHGPSADQGKSSELKRLGGSQNPVSKLESPLFLPKSTLQKALGWNQCVADIQTKIKGRLNENLRKVDREKLEKELKLIEEIDSQVQPVLASHEKIDKKNQEILAKLRSFVMGLISDDEIDENSHLNILLERLTIPDSVSGYVKKEDLEKHLKELIIRLETDQERGEFRKKQGAGKPNENLNPFSPIVDAEAPPPSKKELIQSLELALKRLKDSPLNYLSSQLNIFKDLNLNPDLLTKNCPIYVSVQDLIKKNGDKIPALKSYIERSKSFADQPDFVFKVGLENEREILAGQLLAPLSLGTFYIQKQPERMEGAEIQTATHRGRQVFSQNPEGIVGKWLERGQDYDRESLRQLAIAKMKLEEALFRNEDRGTISLLEQKVKEAENALLKFGSLKSSEEILLTGLIFCSYDDHAGQIKQQDGELYHFDFARFLAPSHVYKKQSSQADQRSETYATLRTFLLDHPIANQPIPQELIQKIQSWNLQSLEEEYRKRGLIGDQASYDLALHEIETINQDWSQFKKDPNPSKETILQLLEKHSIPKDQYELIEPENLGQFLQAALSKKIEGIKKIHFKKVHPQAFEQMKSRIKELQNYLSQCSLQRVQPTMNGAFEVMYPHFVPFMKVIRRFEEYPGQALAINTKEVNVNSLESFIRKAKELNLASEGEIQAMQKSLEALQKEACSNWALLLTMDFS